MSPSFTEKPDYPAGVPQKFTADGIVQRYPGNTTVCHIPLDSPLIPRLRLLCKKLSSHPTIGPIFRAVPEESWHMTVLDGVREEECEPGMWREGVEKRPIPEYTKEFTPILRKLGGDLHSLGLAPPYRMRARGVGPLDVGFGIAVEGATAKDEKRIRRLRDTLADALDLRVDNHEVYAFHITMGYWLRHVDRAELDTLLADILPQLQLEFDLGAVEFCTFDNMCAYPRLFYLGEGES